VLAAATLALAGCAVSRSELAIQAPKTPALKPGAPVIFIRAITDARVFEEQPKNPNIPSLGGDGAAKATAEVKARAVARKRNSYGQALGDVLLDNGQTVAGIVRDNLTAAFGDAGYAVQAGTAAPAGAIVVDVTVRKFWAWVQPGFTEITQQIDIDAGLVFSGKGGKQDVSAHASEGRVAVGDDAWRDIIEKGLVEFRKKSAAAAKALPR
jgi:class 3 adenylate cyclase